MRENLLLSPDWGNCNVNNLFYYVNKFCIEICINFCLYMLSIIVPRKKIGIGKNPYQQVTLPKKSESAKKTVIGASLV